MSLKSRRNRLAREAEQGGIILRQRDGTLKVFSEMDVYTGLFLAKMDLFRNQALRPQAKKVFDAVRNAVPDDRDKFERQFGPISFSVHIIAADYQGGWVKARKRLEDGSIEETFHEGGSPEAERIRRECRERGPRHH